MGLDSPSLAFDDFAPGNYAGHAAELAPRYVALLRHHGHAADQYGGPNYRKILLLAAEEAARQLQRPLTTQDLPRDDGRGGTIVMNVADWTDDDVCVCVDRSRRIAALFGQVRVSDMKGFVCRPRREAGANP